MLSGLAHPTPANREMDALVIDEAREKGACQTTLLDLAFPQGLKPTWSEELLYGLKPVPFKS
jgi:hypothetical protein